MEIPFYKYQGTGNDFIMIDGESHKIELSLETIRQWCDRRFGIGADGLIILKKHPEADFEMDYYNADGSQSFCGNGSRCAQAFAYQLGWIEDTSKFIAIDGLHRGEKRLDGFATKMGDVHEVEFFEKDYIINTGSPHYIRFVKNVEQVEVEKEGAGIRYSERFKEKGINVNFVEETTGGIKVRTYERGVEAETFSCGTGVTAAAIAYLCKNKRQTDQLQVETKGGSLLIQLQQKGTYVFEEIWLAGPAEEVFKGGIKF